jgi:hypothetical protein
VTGPDELLALLADDDGRPVGQTTQTQAVLAGRD